MSELEAAIADTGALLVRAQRYRRGAGPVGAALRAEALALGDAARRLHRRDALDEAAAGRLLGTARDLAARLRALLGEVRDAPEYRAAMTAHAAGDHAVLARTLPAIFAGLERVAPPAALFVPIAWQRRGRPRPAVELAAEVVALRDTGLEAEGDDLSPGADAALPAVVLLAAPPPDEPVVLRVPGALVRGPLHRLADTGELLIHAPRVRLAGVVRLASTLPGGEQLRIDLAPADWARHRGELAAALAAASVPVEDG